MARELINANITHVSYVDKGANKKQFFLTKSADEPTFQKEVKVFVNKEDEAQKLVYGVVYEPDVEDSHGDFMTADEIEKAAHGFVKDARNIDKQHDFEAGVGEVVESYIAPVDMTIGEEQITKGSWVLVTKASEEIWEAIQKGEFTGYSLAGTAETIEKQGNEKPVSKSEDDTEMKGFFNLLKSFFTGEKIEKGAVKDQFDKRKKGNNFWVAIDSFETALRQYNWQSDEYEFEEDESKIREAIQDLSDILIDLLATENIAKSIGKPTDRIQKEEDEMKAEDIKKALGEALLPINERLEAIEKEVSPAEPNQTKQEDGGDDQLEQLKAVMKEALAPINERLETVEKARGTSKQADPEGASHIEKSDGPLYMRHFG
ncbi:XkdF-like putative serine protease domain-containing protein [Sporosarcina obsidiansis]|uniref:XkdF-like putative serine protease domain-containing protein n=1 Tax=Sporosarcina obsidiansis TaxID=2660748 RepID=UPI00129B5E94|nr:XkdF-like putative serine protease domain-containing protein [Sporosarcina obsidiansis]